MSDECPACGFTPPHAQGCRYVVGKLMLMDEAELADAIDAERKHIEMDWYSSMTATMDDILDEVKRRLRAER